MFDVSVAVAVSCVDSWIPVESLGELWSTKSVKDINMRANLTTLDTLGYPHALGEKQQQQMQKVYQACVPPSLYLPQLFTKENAPALLAGGPHCYMNLLPENQYLVDEDGRPQHWRHPYGLRPSSISV